MRKRFTFVLIETALCLGACWWSAVAQTSTSQISGVVTDPSHAVIPGAAVTATNEATGVVMHQTTTGSGVFQFSSIPPGSYTLTVEAGGFKTEKRTGVIVNVGTPATSNFTVEVGAATETVQVTAAAVALTTNNATLGEVIDRREVAQLPLNGRNPQMLITVQPGMVETTGADVNVNGGRAYSSNLTIDGIDANESSAPGLTKNLYGLTPDNVQEINVVTSNPDAQVGRNSGANISVATRAGTNQFHGSLYEYFRNTDLNAADFYGNARNTAKQQLHANQYGFNVGGPIVKNKTFFFGSYQGQYVNVALPIQQAYGSTPTLYTPTARQGIFRYFVANPNQPFSLNGHQITQNSPLLVNPTTGALNPGVRNCASPTDSNCVASFNIAAADPLGIGLDPTIAKMLASEPAVNNYGLGDGLNTGGYSWNTPYQVRGPSYVVRVDHTFNENNSIFAHYIYSQFNNLNGDPANQNPQVLPGFAPEGESYWPAHNFGLSYRHVLSPAAMNNLTVGFSRVLLQYTQGQANPSFPNIPAYTFNLATTPYWNAPLVQRTLTTPQIIDDFTVMKGSHIISAGGNIRMYEQNDYRGSVGGYTLSPTVSLSATTRPPTGFGLPGVAGAGGAGISSADLANLQSAINDVLGIPASITQRFNGNLNSNTYMPYLSNGKVNMFDEGYRMKQYDLYLQDVWKIRPDLTATYGVRWEMNMAPTEAAGRVYVPNLPIDGSQGPVNFVHANSYFPRNNLDAIAPRLSVAWNPGGGKNVIRAGYGIAYDTLASLVITAVASSVPGEVGTCGVTFSSTGAATTTPNCTPVANLRVGQGFAQQLAPPSYQPQSFLSPSAQVKSNAPNVGVFAPDMKVPTVHEWNLTYQRQLQNDLAVSVAYVGKRGTRLYRNYNINQVNAGPILPSFLDMQQNVADHCKADGSGCPSGVVGVPVPLVTSAIVSSTFVNSSATSTDLAQNAAGNFAARIENTTLAAHLRPNQQFNTIDYLDSGGDSYYHSLQATLQKRFSAGLTLGAAYTFSKSIDDLSADPSGASTSISSTSTSGPVDISNWRNERALSNFNRQQVLTVNSVYQLPFGKGLRFLNAAGRLVNAIAGGWSLSGLGIFETGQPFSVYSGALTNNGTHQSYAALSGSTLPVAKLQDEPGIVGPVLFTGTQGFALPAPGGDGAGRNLYTGPSFWNIDLSVSKEFTIGERYHLTFRGEAYNLMNHMNFSTGTLSILSSTFGQNLSEVASATTRNVVRTGEPERVIQLALRLSF